jgi:hypothetical protein
MSENEVKRPVCPNCGGAKVLDFWVKKLPKLTYKNITFAEQATILKTAKAQVFEGDISFEYPLRDLSKYCQVVIRCATCKYTEVFPISAVSTP